MDKAGWKENARTWIGLGSACTALLSATLLLAFYLHGRIVTPGDEARVKALKEEAKTDIEVQKVLQPEMDRQHLVLVKRRTVYDWGGLALLVSAGVLLIWYRWFRPDRGCWAAVPAWLRAYLEMIPDRAEEASAKKLPRNVEEKAARLTPAMPALPPLPASPPPALDLGAVQEILESRGRDPEAVIPILQAIQSRYRYLPGEALKKVCEASAISPARIAGVSTFYGQFRHEPVGEHVIRVCEGTACHVSGAVEVENELRRCLRMTNGSDTDPSGRFTIERIACVGSCSLAPVVTIDEEVYGRLSALTAGRTISDFFQALARKKKNGNGKRGTAEAGLPGQSAGARPRPVEIRIGLGSCGIASGARQVQTALQDAVVSLGGGADVKPVGCGGLCHAEPLVEVLENGSRTLYGNVAPDDVRKIARRHIPPSGLLRKVREGLQEAHARLFDDRAWVPAESREVDAAPYMNKQVRVVLENCGQIDPLSLDDYRAREGTQALEQCLKLLSPEAVIEKVRLSGLRGRGGAGFPTAVKWNIVRRASGDMKYVICNGDEGDPGAFMDRAVMEADPFRVVEGLAIAAYAVGAAEGFVYVRREYPIASRHMKEAIRLAGENGLLGERILGSDFSFRLDVREGAGAFVCGEETALILSMEGERGMPRLRPPYPAEAGLWGKPTLINNVETLACLPWILRRGPEAFAAMGTEKSKGTKVFSLVGKVNRGGLIEVPMGITIREIVEDIGGGIRDGRKFKAVLAGGPSGGCIPASLADTRIDYEELASTGSIMGSGGLAVLDDRDCAVEIARYFLHFTQNESCGKCTFCRIGTKRMLEILERICEGKGRETDLRTLEELSGLVKKASLCGLGQTAPNPVLTTLRYFRHEYEAHIRDRRCPAAQCKALIHYRVLDNCTGCTLCAQACPAAAIENRPYERHEVIDDLCTRCGMCVSACPENAIEVA